MARRRVGVAGVVLVNWDSSGLGGGMSLLGEGFLLISMLACALSAGMIKQYGQTDDPVALSGGQFVLGGAAMIGLRPARRRQADADFPARDRCAAVSCAAFRGGVHALGGPAEGQSGFARGGVYVFAAGVWRALSFLLVDSASGVPLARYAAALVLVCLSITIVNRGQRAGAKTAEKD